MYFMLVLAVLKGLCRVFIKFLGEVSAGSLRVLHWFVIFFVFSLLLGDVWKNSSNLPHYIRHS